MTDPRLRLGFSRVNDVTLHHASCGEPGKPLVILLHGFPEAWFAWEKQLLDLGRDYLAVAPDLRGFNLSDKPAAVRDYRAHVVAKDVVALAASMGYERFHLVGHDWGGAIAYTVAIAYPQCVERLVIINAVHPAIFARELRQSPAQVAASEYINLFRQPQASAHLLQNDCTFLLDMLSDHQGRLPEWLDVQKRERYVQAWTQPGALDGGLNYYRASALHPPSQEDPGIDAVTLDEAALRVQAPTLMLWGERDRFLLPGCAEGVQAHVPNLCVRRFPEASHWIVHELSDAVTHDIRAHLQADEFTQG